MDDPTQDGTLSQQPDGTVVQTITQEVVVQSYSQDQIDALNAELSDIQAAVVDIDNFKQRRLDNLAARTDEINQILGLLTN